MLTPHTHPIRFRDVDHALRVAAGMHPVRAINLEGVSIPNDGWRNAAILAARSTVLAVVSALPPLERALVVAHAKGVGYHLAAKELRIGRTRAGLLLHEGLATVGERLRAFGLLEG